MFCSSGCRIKFSDLLLFGNYTMIEIVALDDPRKEDLEAWFVFSPNKISVRQERGCHRIVSKSKYAPLDDHKWQRKVLKGVAAFKWKERWQSDKGHCACSPPCGFPSCGETSDAASIPLSVIDTNACWMNIPLMDPASPSLQALPRRDSSSPQKEFSPSSHQT